MATHGRGLICLPLTEERVRQLGISMMVSDNTSPFGTAFTVSVDSATGISTGISAADRAKTILDAIADEAKPQDLVTPGHIFRCAPAMAASWCARDKPKARSTWPVWRGSSRPGLSAKL